MTSGYKGYFGQIVLKVAHHVYILPLPILLNFWGKPPLTPCILNLASDFFHMFVSNFGYLSSIP